MNGRLILICEGPNDEEVGGVLVERFVGRPGGVWNWEANEGRPRAFLYWREWRSEWSSHSRRMRGTLSIPEPIRELKKYRGEAVVGIKVVHVAKSKYPKSSIILIRDSDGKEQRVAAWRVFQQTRKRVVVGIAKKSVEAWVLACWDPTEEQVRDASIWVKQERGSAFDPFREPDRLTPRLSKRLLESLGYEFSSDYADVVLIASDDQMRSEQAERAGLSQFVEQINTKLAHLVEARAN